MNLEKETVSSGFVTNHNQPVVIKSPEYASQKQALYIMDVFQKFKYALYTSAGIHPKTERSYENSFDLDSFVKRYIIAEITRNIEAGVSSNFFYEPAVENQPVYFVPLLKT